MIDTAVEDLISFAEAAKQVPSFKRGRPTSVSTVYRWALHGSRGIKLDHVRTAGRMMTSKQALQRYADGLTTKMETARL